MDSTQSLLFSPKTLAQYKVEAKKNIKIKLTMLAIVFLSICTLLQVFGWITPLLINLIALTMGLAIIYFIFKEIIRLKKINPLKLKSEIDSMNDDAATRTIIEIQKKRKVCNLDLELIKIQLRKKSQ